jgi:hypothetical protein
MGREVRCFIPDLSDGTSIPTCKPYPTSLYQSSLLQEKISGITNRGTVVHTMVFVRKSGGSVWPCPIKTLI